jgi:hypothetical protein
MFSTCLFALRALRAMLILFFRLIIVYSAVPSICNPSCSGKPGRKARASLKKKSGGDDE